MSYDRRYHPRLVGPAREMVARAQEILEMRGLRCSLRAVAIILGETPGSLHNVLNDGPHHRRIGIDRFCSWQRALADMGIPTVIQLHDGKMWTLKFPAHDDADLRLRQWLVDEHEITESTAKKHVREAPTRGSGLTPIYTDDQ